MTGPAVDRPRPVVVGPARPLHLPGRRDARWSAPSRAVRDSLALLVLAAAAGCAVTAVHVDHGLRPGRPPRPDVVAARPPPGSGPGSGPSGSRSPDGPNLEARARAARRAGPGRTRPPGTRPTTRPRRSWSTCCGAPVVHGLAGMRPVPSPPDPRPAPVRDRGALRPPGARPVPDPQQRRPPLRAQPGAGRAAAPVLRHRRPGRRPVLARQAALLAGDADLLDAWALSTRPTPPRSRRHRGPGPPGRAAVAGRRRPHPPPADAVERVLEVARLERRATEVPGGVRVARSGGRLPGGPARGLRSSGTVVT